MLGKQTVSKLSEVDLFEIMLFAKDESGERIEATKSGIKATCPTCGGGVRAKCGRINHWHWAHINTDECDAWSERESEWHLSWKRLLPSHQVEVVIEKHGQRHRADIQTTRGLIVELQHSYLAPHKILEREWFYKNMIWIFDARDVWEKENFELDEQETYYKFRWKYPKKHVAHTDAPCYLDFGFGRLFLIKKMYLKSSCYGWGYFVDVAKMLEDWQSTVGSLRYRH